MRARLASDHPRLILVVYCLLCWLPGFFTIPATDRDESRFAQATRQMLETGDFVDIRNGTEPRNRKPIGIHWLQAPFAAVARLSGVAAKNPIWPYRLPSLIGALMAVLVTRAIGARLFGPPQGLLAAAMLGGSVLLTVEAHLAKTDASLLAATTVVMAILCRAYLGRDRVGPGEAAAFWVALGVGVLIKGPITPMVAGLTAATLAAADRRAAWLGALRPAWGVPLALAVVLPWFVAIELSTHGRFLAEAAGGDLAGKISGGDDAHGAPPGYHLLALSAALFPAAFAVLRALPQAWAARREPAVRFLLAWAGPAWLVFEAVPTKLPHYPLPLYPSLCLVGAWWLLRSGRSAPRWLAIASTALFLAACALFGIGAAVLPWVVGPMRAPLDWIGLPALLAAGLIAALVLRAGTDMRRAVLSGLVAVPVLYWALLGVRVAARGAVVGVCPSGATGLFRRRRRTGGGGVRRAEPDVCRGHQYALSGRRGSGALSARWTGPGSCGRRPTGSAVPERGRQAPAAPAGESRRVRLLQRTPGRADAVRLALKLQASSGCR